MTRHKKRGMGFSIRRMFFACAVAAALFAASAARAEYDMTGVVVDGNARFTVITPECIRLEYSKTGAFVDLPSMFAANRAARSREKTEFRLSRDGGATVIDTGKIRLTYTPDGKPFGESNIRAEIKKGGGVAEWHPGAPNGGNLGGTIRTVDGVVGPVDLGEGVLSRDGWYLLDDSRRHLLTADWVAARASDSGTDWYLFGYGYDYPGAIRAMTAVGGEAPMPRKYALGVWYSRYWPYTSKEYREIVKEYDDHGFPLDVMVMDMDWHKDGWTGWSWNRTLLPDAEELLKWFHEQGLAVTLNLHPADGIGPHEDMYADFMRAMGKDPASKETITFDAGDRKYIDTLFEFAVAPHEREGVDFWWLDWQQYQYTISVPELTNLAWLNHYFFKHTSLTGRRGQSFSRWAGWGDHRNPVHFSGDAHTGFPMLAFEVPLTSTAGNVGCFFWSHDIGGHMGPRNPESYTRWVQFGATSPALRSHSTRNLELDRRPWKYEKWAEDSMRVSFRLRSRIFPYIYSTAWQAHRDSVPLSRPMYLYYPENEKAYRNPQQYFFGDSMLAAPVVSQGAGPGKVGRQVVWFPDGVWFNWFTNERYEGGEEAAVAADIDEFPLYAKGGMPIPMQPYTHRMATTPLSELIVRCWPGKDGDTNKFQLYEDDGITNDYLKGKYALTYLVYHREGDTVTVTVDPKLGDYAGSLKERAVTIELPATKKAASAKIGDVEAPVEYDEKTLTNRIRVPAGPLDRGVVVTVRVADADQAELRKKAEARRIEGLGLEGKDFRGAAAAFNIGEKGTAKLDALLAAGGVALYRKNEALYLYNPQMRTYFYARPGALDGDSFRLTVEDRLGDKKTVLYDEKQAVKKSAAFAMPDLPPERKDKPADAFGLEVSRVAKVSFTINGKPFELEQVIDSRVSYLSKWNITGPFPYNRGGKIDEQKYGPEAGPVSLSAVYRDGIGGKGVNWRRAQADENGVVDLQKNFYIPGDDRAAYAVTYLDSDAAQPATFLVNSDDGVEVWLNGDKIHSNNAARNIASETDTARANLKQGRNELLVKISQHNYDWGFRVGVETRFPIKESFGKK